MKRYYFLTILLLLVFTATASNNLSKNKSIFTRNITQIQATSNQINSDAINKAEEERPILYALVPLDYNFDLYYKAFQETINSKNWNANFYRQISRVEASLLWQNENTAFYSLFDGYFYEDMLLVFNCIWIEGYENEVMDFYSCLIEISNKYGISYHIERFW